MYVGYHAATSERTSRIRFSCGTDLDIFVAICSREVNGVLLVDNFVGGNPLNFVLRVMIFQFIVV